MGLGKSLKKIAKKVGPVINPVVWATSVPGGVKDVMNFGSKKGPDNPYAPGDWNRLFDNTKFDYLKDANAKAYDPAQAESERLFQSYLGSIQAPSSVDAVRSGVENEQYQNALRDIGRETDKSIASSKLDYADRGLGGPGQISDIEAVGLAQLRGQGEEKAANARLSLYQAELDRLKNREQAATSAYGQRYQSGTNLAAQKAGSGLDLEKFYADLISGRETSGVSGQAGQYAAAEDRKYQYAKPGYLDSILRNINVSVPIG